MWFLSDSSARSMRHSGMICAIIEHNTSLIDGASASAKWHISKCDLNYFLSRDLLHLQRKKKKDSRCNRWNQSLAMIKVFFIRWFTRKKMKASYRIEHFVKKKTSLKSTRIKIQVALNMSFRYAIWCARWWNEIRISCDTERSSFSPLNGPRHTELMTERRKKCSPLIYQKWLLITFFFASVRPKECVSSTKANDDDTSEVHARTTTNQQIPFALSVGGRRSMKSSEAPAHGNF